MNFEFIKLGKYASLESDSIFDDEIVLDAVKEYRKNIEIKSILRTRDLIK